MEVRNRFKGLDLIDRVPDELWTEVRDIVQVIKTIPKKKKCKKTKWLSEEALQIAEKRTEVKSKGAKGTYNRSQKAMAPHSSTLAWKTPWAEEPGGLQSMGS